MEEIALLQCCLSLDNGPTSSSGGLSAFLYSEGGVDSRVNAEILKEMQWDDPNACIEQAHPSLTSHSSPRVINATNRMQAERATTELKGLFKVLPMSSTKVFTKLIHAAELIGNAACKGWYTGKADGGLWRSNLTPGLTMIV